MSEPKVRQAKRAGGYELVDGRWVLAGTRRPEPAPEPDQTDSPPRLDYANVKVPREMVGPDPERQECPDCGKDVALNKDGSLRKHTCVEE